MLKIIHHFETGKWRIVVDCQNKVNFDGNGYSYKEAFLEFGVKLSIEENEIVDRTNWLNSVQEHWSDLFNLGEP